MMSETPKLHDHETHSGQKPSLRFNASLFILSLASLPYLFYVSMAGILVVLGRLIRTYQAPCLDQLTKSVVGAIALLLLWSSMNAYEPGEAYLHLANFLPYLLLFAYLPGLLRRLETLENLAIALVLTTVPINVIAIVEFIVKATFLPGAWQSVPLIEAIRNAPHRGRAMVMFDHPNVMASYMVLVLGLALGLLMMQLDYGAVHRQTLLEHAQTPTKISPDPSPSNSSAETTGFTSGFSSSSLLVRAIALILIGIFCTGSRNGLAIAFSQLLVFVFTARLNRRILGGIAFLVGVFAVAVIRIGLGERQIGIFNLSDDPRAGIWAIALELIKERPWFGWGLGNFKFLYPPRLIDPEYQDIFHPHNIWLLLGTEAGILVMILMSLLVGFICYRVIRYCLRSPKGDHGSAAVSSRRAIAMGYLLAFWGCLGFALFDATFYDVRINALNWTLLAALYAIPYALHLPDSSASDGEIQMQESSVSSSSVDS